LKTKCSDELIVSLSHRPNDFAVRRSSKLDRVSRQRIDHARFPHVYAFTLPKVKRFVSFLFLFHRMSSTIITSTIGSVDSSSTTSSVVLTAVTKAATAEINALVDAELKQSGLSTEVQQEIEQIVEVTETAVCPKLSGWCFSLGQWFSAQCSKCACCSCCKSKTS
jgi:hypothetical protein